MAHPYHHARSSARRLGGTYRDYLHLHMWLDSTRGYIGDDRHILLLHNAWGITLGEQLFGITFIRDSDGYEMPTRPIFEQHVKEDLGCIPSLSDCFKSVPIEEWMYRNAMPIALTLGMQGEDEANNITEEMPEIHAHGL